MPGRVIQILICPVKGQPMEEVIEVYASRESGLMGDRYGLGEGSWSTWGKVHRQVSLIACEAIEAANKGNNLCCVVTRTECEQAHTPLLASRNRELLRPYLAIETRRNILTHGLDLNSLVGKEFSIGQARLRGTKLCDPCERPAFLAGRKGDERKLFPIAFHDRGGLCAEVIADGFIRISDLIVCD